MLYISLRPTIPHALVLSYATIIWRISPKLRISVVWLELSCMDKVTKISCHDNVPLRDQKPNFILMIYSRSSINPENLAKFGPIDIHIGLAEIVRKK